MRILIIDDDKDIREILKYNLNKEGYETREAKDGEEGLKMCFETKPDLILLDIMMPGMDGIEVCETIRKTPGFESVLICFLTARGEDYSQIAGLDAGADDFVAKPVKPKVLISRINAMMRRKPSDVKVVSEGLIIDRERYHVELNGSIIQLPRKEFELLALLVSKPGFVFEREVILDTVWGSEIIVGDRTIDVHIRKLREKIGSEYIVTIKGIGYKYENKT